jgi:hypothetical protein
VVSSKWKPRAQRQDWLKGPTREERVHGVALVVGFVEGAEASLDRKEKHMQQLVHPRRGPKVSLCGFGLRRMLRLRLSRFHHYTRSPL